jgi:23S rRNA pseudouridine1911/1915/1917 synthase
MEATENKDIKFEIVAENPDFMVVEKPAGLLVHATLKNENNTLVNGLLAIRPEIKSVGDDPIRPGIVHRLDKDTSGLMIVAKNQATFEKLKEKFQNHQMHKTYTALVFGKLKDPYGIIDKPILRSGSKFNRRKIGIEPNDGKEAITEYETIKYNGKVSLVKAFPKTGRTHQIRVHFASMSNYVIGDTEYGSDKVNKEYNLNRQFLHASELEFSFKSKKYHFKSKLPGDLQKVLDTLGMVD